MQLAQGVSAVIDVYCLMIIVWCLLSFFPRIDERHPIVHALDTVTSPVLKPIRALLPPMAGLDLSPMVALLLLRGIQQLMVGL